MALIPSCVNNGGLQSIIRLPVVPRLEQDVAISDESLGALECWTARSGEVLTVVDPEETAYRARMTCIAEGSASCVPFERLSPSVESAIRIDVYQSLPDKERFELVLQKLTELGVDRIAPMESVRSATLMERDAGQKKSHRWPDVVSKAARQCRRAMLPELMSVCSFDDMLRQIENTELKLMLYEGESSWAFCESLGSLRPQSVALLVGPEGGFAESEVEMARSAGILPVGLGPRILRTETAAIVGAALLQSYLGDLK